MTLVIDVDVVDGVVVDVAVAGEIGPPGVGVPTGGTTAQVLAKNSNTNYDTEWVDAAAGGGGGGAVDSVNGQTGVVVLNAASVGADAAGAAAAVQAASQPRDSDLTAIALLSTTSFGRSFLELADAPSARSGLGLGTAATQNTGAFDAAGAAASAQAASQPLDSDLTAVAALTPANDDVIQRKAGVWTNRTITQLAADLGAVSGYQPLDSDLTAIAALATSSFGRSLLTQADAATARATLGVNTAFGINVKDSPYLATPSSTVDCSAALQTALSASSNRTVFAEGTYALAHPIVVPSGVTFKGAGGMQAGSSLVTTAAFYNSTVNGAQTTPALSTTSFTFTVASTANAPLGVGGITPTGSHGVICVSGITIFYTGTTGTTFTGCHVQDIDVNVTIPDAAPVSTFMVWLDAPGNSNSGFGARIENFDISAGAIPGVSCVHSAHVQEGGGVYECNISGYRNFGIRIERDTSGTAHGGAGQWDIHGLWMRCSGSAEAGAVDIDIIGLRLDQNVSGRGIRDVTFVSKNLAVGPFPGIAAVRLNGTSGRFGDFHIENHNIGVLVGDKQPCSVVLENINQDNAWGTGARIDLGNTQYNTAIIRGIFIGGTGTGGTILNDHVNSYTYKFTDQAKHSLTSYILYSDGTYQINGGGRVGPVANRPAASIALTGATWIDKQPADAVALVADNVASGARDNSSSSTLTVTFTAATTVGHHVLLAATASNVRALTGIVDSRGNTWQVDEVSAVAVTANAASCRVTVAHQIGDTLTLTFAGANTYAAAICSEWSGLYKTGWVDVVAANAGDSGAGVANTGLMPVRTQPDDLVFAVVGYNNATNEAAGAGMTALTTKSSGAGNRKVTPIYKLVSVTAVESLLWNANAGGWDTVGVAYKANLPPLTVSVCDGVRWDTVGTVTGGGDLISTNNLSDLTSASIARTNLGLGTAATSAATAFETAGAAAAAQAASQPLDADLTTIAGLIATTDNFIVSVASAWASRTPAQVKTTLALNNVDNTSNATERAATATLTNKTLTSPVVNTPTGIVKGDVGLGSVDNTSDASKATTEASATRTLTNKTLTSPVINTPTGIVKGDVGLGNVDNTADASKPVSTAQAAADAAVAAAAQPVDSDLTTIAGLTATTDNMIQSVGSAWASRTPTQVKTALGLTIGTNVQAWDADLDAIAALTSAADKLPYATGAQTWSLTTLSSFIRTLLDDADAATARATLGISSGAVASDVIWDAAGDLAVGTGADTAAKLSVGSAGQVLGIAAGATTPSWVSVTGWNEYSPTITRTAGTTFTTAADTTNILSPGTPVRWKEGGGFKYGVIATSVFSSTTLVTLIGTDDYTMAANPDANTFAFSHAQNPVGLPSAFSYTPTITGYSANPTNVRYTWRVLANRTISVTIAETTSGTSSLTTKTYSLPTGVTAVTLTNQSWGNLAFVFNNAAAAAGQLQVSSAGTVINAFATGAGGAWTASSTARVAFGNVAVEF